MRALACAAAVLAACGDEGGTKTPDAGGLDAPGDAPDTSACREFHGTALSVPVHVTGSLDKADVQSPMQCGVVDAPYGIESMGPDSVIKIDGLVAGTPYVVKLDSPSDLAFYVSTGCSAPSGPAEAECALFVDASSGSREVGRFVAEGPVAYVVVDYYASHAPQSNAFMLDVYAEACTSAAQCNGATPVCSAGRCVECTSSFDCGSAVAPRCDAVSNTCIAGMDLCTTDDLNEPANDGPAGAVPLVLDAGGNATVTAQICSQPRTESDYYKLQVTSLGDVWDISVNWTGTRDLDLEVLDAEGETMGLSFWEHPETMRLTYLPLGTYYVRVRDFSASTTTSIAYTLTAHRTAGTACTTRDDCGAEFRNQLYRGDCVAGACVPIEGGGAVAEGDACDSVSDCGAGLSCPSYFFVQNAATRNVCARSCNSDSNCAPLGPDYVCTTYLVTNICVQKCTTSLQCPTSLDDPPQAGPWYRFTCNATTGRCAP